MKMLCDFYETWWPKICRKFLLWCLSWFSTKFREVLFIFGVMILLMKQTTKPLKIGPCTLRFNCYTDLYYLIFVCFDFMLFCLFRFFVCLFVCLFVWLFKAYIYQELNKYYASISCFTSKECVCSRNATKSLLLRFRNPVRLLLIFQTFGDFDIRRRFILF